MQFSYLLFDVQSNCLMFILHSQYDLSANQFSPDGRVFQVEYAMKAVENSRYAVSVIMSPMQILQCFSNGN